MADTLPAADRSFPEAGSYLAACWEEDTMRGDNYPAGFPQGDTRRLAVGNCYPAEDSFRSVGNSRPVVDNSSVPLSPYMPNLPIVPTAH